MTLHKTVIVCGAGYVSGKEIVSIELGRGLVERGYPTHFLTSFWNDGDFQSRLEKSNLPFEIMPLGFISATLSRECIRMTAEQIRQWPSLLWSYHRMLRREMPTRVVHTNWHHLLLLWPFLSSSRDIYWVHDTFPATARYCRFLRLLSRRIGGFVCVSQVVASSVLRAGVAKRQVRVIHNGIRDPAAATVPRLSNCDTIHIGIVGQVGAWKGHDDLVEAFAIAAQNHSSLQLHIFGTGEAATIERIRLKAAELGIAQHITWHGFESVQAQIYPLLDICVVPSRSEDPLPTTAIEAGFFSLPVVASRRGGLPEIVQDGETGILVEPQSPHELAAAICMLVEQPQLRHQIGQAARRRALNHFNRERFIAEFGSVLNGCGVEQNRFANGEAPHYG